MRDDAWVHLVEDFVEGRISVDAFHDRFFDLWHASFEAARFPEPIERLFFTVEAYCPEPSLRDPLSSHEASETDVFNEAQLALSRLKAGRR